MISTLSTWYDTNPHFCEGYGTAPSSPEIVNSLTSITMTFVGIHGLVNLVRIKSEKYELSMMVNTLYIYYFSLCALIVNGINSGVYHGTLQRGWAGMDVSSMIMILFPMCYELLRSISFLKCDKGTNNTILRLVSFAILVELGILTCVLGSIENGHTFSSIAFFGVMVVALVIIGYHLYNDDISSNCRQCLMSTIGFTLIAIIFWASVEFICELESTSDTVKKILSYIPSHGIWHITISIAGYNLIYGTMLYFYKCLRLVPYEYTIFNYALPRVDYEEDIFADPKIEGTELVTITSLNLKNRLRVNLD